MSETVLREAEPPISDDMPSSDNVVNGFGNPDILAKAQETRRKNREGKTPEALLDGAEAEPSGKGRGRGRSKRSERSLQQIESMLVKVHFMLSAATGFPELVIDDTEAKTLAQALAGVSEYYNIKLDGKSGAIMGLIYAVGIVYGPRVVSIAIRKKREHNGGPKLDD